MANQTQTPVPLDFQPLASPMAMEHVTIQYGNKVAVRDVSLLFAPKSITALIGPSGCGKTTLLTSLNRLTDLIPHCRVSGSVRLAELEIFDQRIDVIELRRRVGMIFQRPNPFPMSIRRNLELPLREHGLRDRHKLAEKVERTLTEVGLWTEVKDRLDRSALTLSGGQQQRLCLARALALNPEVILLDEPCSSLDPLSVAVIEDLLVRLRANCTIVVVTHNLAQARRIADSTAFLWADEAGGRLIEHRATKALFDSPRESLTAAFVTGRVG
ncbi:MAG: phosphate transporter ATP-binding protein PhoT family [Planctomycetaceae bacterium]|nr:phosphate transporter ATP-binding protein PhoT family [Planctomycetaceae bacterium]